MVSHSGALHEYSDRMATSTDEFSASLFCPSTELVERLAFAIFSVLLGRRYQFSTRGRDLAGRQREHDHPRRSGRETRDRHSRTVVKRVRARSYMHRVWEPLTRVDYRGAGVSRRLRQLFS